MSRILEHVATWVDAIPETQDSWFDKVKELASLHRGAGWHLAYWVGWGLKMYDIAVEDLAIQLDRSEQTIRNYKSVMMNPAATIAKEYGLSVSHAVEVLGEPDKEAWLLRAKEERWSTAKLRAELRATRVATLSQVGSAPPVTPPPTYPQCYQCREEGRSSDATRVGVSGRLLCDYHYNNGPDPEPEPDPDPADYQYSEEFDDDDPPFSCYQEPDNPGIYRADIEAAAEEWVDTLPMTQRTMGQKLIRSFIAFYTGR